MSLFGAEAIFGDLVSDGIAGLQSAVTQYAGIGYLITKPQFTPAPTT